MPAGATWTKISTVNLTSGSTTITFSSISDTYTDLMVVGSLKTNRSSGDATEIRMTMNGSTTNYAHKGITGNGTSASDASASGQARAFISYTNQSTTGQTDTFGGFQVSIPNKTFAGQPYYLSSGFSEIAATNGYINWEGGTNTGISASITSLTFLAYSGADDWTYLTNSTVTLYGLTRA